MSGTSPSRYAPADVRSLLTSNAIVRSAHWQISYPIEFLSKRAYKKLTALAVGQCNGTDIENLPVLLRAVEAYLAVTGRKLDFVGGAFRPRSVVVDFFGALYSARFLNSTEDKCYRWARTWRNLTGQTCPSILVEVPKPSPTKINPWFQEASQRFETLPLVETQVDLWRGWVVLNRAGHAHWFDLRVLYLRYGKGFADGYARACHRFFAGRRAQNLPMAQAFADYLGALPEGWSKESFSSPTRMSNLFSKFLKLQAENFDKRDLQYSTLRDQWVDFSFFVNTYLCNSGLIARNVSVPVLPTRNLDISQTHRKVKKDGTVVVTKLLTDVPLHISNKQAVELVYHQIASDVEVVRLWAQSEVRNIWLRQQRRIELAKIGTPKEVRPGVPCSNRTDSVRRGSPNWEANACATFEHYGFRPSRDGELRTLYPAPIDDLASDTFGLPTKGALIPHMALLVLAHPKLAASFFEELLLYEPNEQLAGVRQTDTGWILDGFKLRKGPDTAQQTIHLSENDADVIAQVIELTRPLRDYLKARNDPTWRYLFLHCGKGFSYPARVTPAEETSYRRRGGGLSASFLASGCIPGNDVERLSRNFSLTTLRSSVAICSYIKEPSIRKLADLLGHESVDMRTIKRYMPPALLDFFQTRWVRLFQCGILLEALKESPYVLPATGFATMDEMMQFLEHHALKWRLREYAKSQQEGKTKLGHFEDEVVFSISVENLTILESLRLAVEQAAEESVSRVARMWRDYAAGLFKYIEASSPPREDYVEMLNQARARASVNLIEKGAIYA